MVLWGLKIELTIIAWEWIWVQVTVLIIAVVVSFKMI